VKDSVFLNYKADVGKPHADRVWCHSGEGTWRGHSPPRSLLAVPNAHPSTASVPINLLPYSGPLLCGIVPVEGLIVIIMMMTRTQSKKHYVYKSK